MSDMVDRVAKAIETQMGAKSTDMARAAIEAMREPTPDMLLAGSTAMRGLIVQGDGKLATLRIGFNAMLDEALGKVEA